jgi:hypothetical protein
MIVNLAREQESLRALKNVRYLTKNQKIRFNGQSQNQAFDEVYPVSSQPTQLPVRNYLTTKLLPTAMTAEYRRHHKPVQR